MFGRGYFTEDYFADYLFYWVGPLADGSGEDSPGAGANSTSESAGCVAPVEGAYPCAGGPIPEGAQQLKEVVGNYGLRWAGAQSPSGNITCDVQPGSTDHGASVLCSVKGWPDSFNPSYEDMGGYPVAGMPENGPFVLGGKGDPMASKNSGSFDGTVLPYGTVWYFLDFAIASEENGFTVWNANSGYGALMNSSGFYPFGPAN